MILVSTVWHSGTHSLVESLEGEAIWVHCSPEAIEMAKSGGYEVYTTDRNPYRVAASWYNRGRWGRKTWETRWRSQWESYRDIRKFATIVPIDEIPERLNDHADTEGMHKLLDDGDLDEFHKRFGKRWINLAMRCNRG